MLNIMLMNTALFIVVASVMVVIAHKFANARLLRKHPELSMVELWGTPAFILRRAGLYGGIVIGSFAVAKNIGEKAFETGSVLQALQTNIALESGLGLLSLLLFIFTALRSVDWIILSNIDNDAAMKQNNISLGMTEGAILLGTGFVAYGSLLGEGHMLSSWVFFAIGQVAFVLMSYLLEYVIHPSHNAKSEIERGDLPSGVVVSSMLLVVAMFVKNGIAGDFYGYARDTMYFLKMMGLQIAFFSVYLFIIEPLLMKVMKLESFSLSGTVIRATLQLGMAGMIVYNVSI
jgi:hypothetical protein